MLIAAASDLFSALAQGKVDAIIGTSESQWLDFKRDPYVLDLEYQKLELAKDITALANKGGGVIVIGFETRKEENTKRDVANQLSRVRRGLVDDQRYRDIIESWTYPPIRNLTLRWWLEEEATGVLTIEVPPASASERPILVIKVTQTADGELRRELLIGICERSDDRVVRLMPAEIHAQIQLGRLIQQSGGLGLAAALTTPQGPTEEERRRRLDEDTRDADLQGQRRYFLQAWPRRQVEVQGLHRADPTGLGFILANPPEIRDTGFGLRTGTTPTVIPGGGLRLITEHRSLSFQRDGLLTWAVSADTDYLAWADEKRGVPHSLNTLALVESTLEFVRLFALQVLPRFDPRPAEWSVQGGMADLWEDEPHTSLFNGQLPVRVLGTTLIPSHANNFTFGPMLFHDELPSKVAFKILREVYLQFGIDESVIRYVRDGEVSEELIRQTR